MKFRPNIQFLSAYGVKVILGILYGYVFLRYYNGDDTWKFYRASLYETQLLLNHTATFFTNEFTPANALATGRNTLEIITIYLNDLQFVLVVKIMAVFNLMTGGNYYLNVVLFNIIFFFGHYWLFKLMTELFPAKRKLYFVLIFLFLPAVFWLSGLRVDGLLFFFMGMLLYYTCSKRKRGVSKVIPIAIGFAGVLICRPQFAALTSVAILAKYLAVRTRKPVAAFVTVYAVAISLFFVPAFGLSAMIAEKQHEFLTLKGTKFEIGNLDPSPVSYVKVLPQAFANIFFRPLPWEAKGALQLFASLEVVAFWSVIIASVVYRHRFWKIRLRQPVILCMLALGISTYIFIAYIVPFPGAFVRYKAIPELLILCSMAAISAWNEPKNYRKL